MWRILGDSLKRGVVTGTSGAPLPADVTPAPREADPEVEVLGQALRVEVRRLFGRSMKLRHVDCGSCNGCESELQALLNPFYDLQRFGFDFVASPRHADALIVTGPPARHLEEALRLTDEATPRPRLVVAVGDCACHGGFCAGSFATLEGVHEVVPVDVRIPGCPPRPSDILRGLLAAFARGGAGRAASPEA
jgi:Ni,Fe-hydrogenase III small subunit